MRPQWRFVPPTARKLDEISAAGVPFALLAGWILSVPLPGRQVMDLKSVTLRARD